MNQIKYVTDSCHSMSAIILSDKVIKGAQEKIYMQNMF